MDVLRCFVIFAPKINASLNRVLSVNRNTIVYILIQIFSLQLKGNYINLMDGIPLCLCINQIITKIPPSTNIHLFLHAFSENF